MIHFEYAKGNNPVQDGPILSLSYLANILRLKTVLVGIDCR